MKPRFTLKFMLKATLLWIFLTVLWYVDTRVLPHAHLDYFREFELIGAWVVLLIGWAVYFLDRYRLQKKGKEDKQC